MPPEDVHQQTQLASLEINSTQNCINLYKPLLPTTEMKATANKYIGFVPKTKPTEEEKCQGTKLFTLHVAFYS